MKLKALDIKLLRDLWSIKGQAVAIAFVMVGGVAMFTMSLSMLDSLRATRDSFYEKYRFADVFAELKRAPENVRNRIADIPGVGAVYTRVVTPVNIDIEGFNDPVTGKIVSIPDGKEPPLNALFLRNGRLPESGRDNEVLVSEAFANAHHFVPGSHLAVVINGKRKKLEITGIALTPEYVLQMSPASMFPDFERYGILWMGRSAISAAYGMEGSFNDVTIKLAHGGSEKEVIGQLDEILKPYGGFGAYGRFYQMSNRFLSEEMRQLSSMATMFPLIFLGVASFLLNVVITRLIATQRQIIAILKGFGYSNIDVGIHYIKLVLIIVFFGVTGGVLAGVWLGKNMSVMYQEFYKFPYLTFHLPLWVVLLGSFITATAAVGGTIFAARRAAMLPPAEGMMPEPPEKFRESIVEKLGLKRYILQPGKMIIRHIERKPFKAFLTILGISFSCAIMSLGLGFKDSMDYMVDAQFALSSREDLSVNFMDSLSRRAVFDLKNIPGVVTVEPFRTVPVQLRFEHRTYRLAVQGLEPSGDLLRTLDENLKPFVIPEDGIVLTDFLGKTLGVKPGDTLTLEVLTGSRAVREVKVARLVKQFMGLSAYMNLDALNKLMREGDVVTGANLSLDRKYQKAIYKTLKEMPRVAGTSARHEALRNFRETMDKQVAIFTFFSTLLAASIAFGVVYNSARITLAERDRELASLRVLGLTRAEISFILLGELAILTLAALPLGFLVGAGLGYIVTSGMQSDLFRIPLVLNKASFAYSALVVLVSAGVSGIIVRRKLDRLDLIGVLKTKE